MGTKTIGLDEEAYELLRAEKREDESFSDVVKRVTGVVSADWRRSFGKYDDSGARLDRVVRASRDRRGKGLAARQEQAVAALGGEEVGVNSEDTDGAVDAEDTGDSGAGRTRSDEQ
jgi:predicted CopG family antitoxin